VAELRPIRRLCAAAAANVPAPNAVPATMETPRVSRAMMFYGAMAAISMILFLASAIPM
jgi:hypothetical protein